MEDKVKISQPSSGSNDVGRDTTDAKGTHELLTGTDTQMHLAAKNKGKDPANQHKKEQASAKKEKDFPEAGQTDE